MGKWLAGAIVVLAAACSSSAGDAETSVVVFAAASLADAFAEIEAAYEAEHPGTNLQVSVAGSSTLREQILEGAPADVYAPADETNMAVVIEAGEAAGAPVVFTTNALAIGVPVGNPGAVTGLADLADPARLVGVCSRGVPCGELAHAVLANAGVEAAVDTEEPDVRALRTKLSVGELDVGLVYISDVRVESAIEGIEIPAEVNVETNYPIVALTDRAQAADVVSFVLSPPAQSILARHGFAP